MFVGKISLLTVVVAALLPALARGQEADIAATLTRTCSSTGPISRCS